ncbi:MAG: class I SAM-dependent methyltransferase [Candidatus Altiarchaeota archaeon]
MKDADTLQLRLNQLGEGLGTAYERYALNRFLERISKRLKVSSVLEHPANGVMGVPGIKSMVLALNGVNVTLANPSKKIMEEARALWRMLGLEAAYVVCELYAAPFKDDSFDLAWNFCCFEHFEEPERIYGEMKRCSARYVLAEVQNIFNVGFILHSLYHKLRGEAWDHGEKEAMDWREVKKVYEACGLSVCEVDGNDMPPWPDINMKLGDILEAKKEALDDKLEFRPDVKTKTIHEIKHLWSKPPKESLSSPRMLFLRVWHDLIERLTPRKLRIFLCHHPYVIGVK